MLAAYVSGHGFGHSTRVAEVLRAVRLRAPGVPIAVVTSAPEALYRDALGESFEYRAVETDVGLAQKDALAIDAEGTLARLRGLAASAPALVAEEALWLRERGARLVLADIPPLAFRFAAEAGVRAVGLANFSWDWIYAHLARAHRGFEEPARAAAGAYGTAALLLELPFAGDLSAFPRREPIPLVTRRPRLAREAARERLGLPGDRPLALLSFGGLGLPGLDLRVLGRASDVFFVVTEGVGEPPSNVARVERARLAETGIGYPELVAAADVVVTKPGYGIVADAIAAGTRIVYTDRGDFPEYPILVRGMAEHLPCAYVSNDDVRAGRLGVAIDDVLARAVPPAPRLDGAELAAERLLSLL